MLVSKWPKTCRRPKILNIFSTVFFNCFRLARLFTLLFSKNTFILVRSCQATRSVLIIQEWLTQRPLFLVLTRNECRSAGRKGRMKLRTPSAVTTTLTTTLTAAAPLSAVEDPEAPKTRRQSGSMLCEPWKASRSASGRRSSWYVA